ncbi:MAG: ATP-binding protein, partial [Synechococcus sp. SB0670_bin_20]|nr:ATP-binding protein [Synechococcus sp. SB0670_bin_20]
MESNLLPDTVWESFSFGQDHYLAVTSEPWHRLEPVAANCSPDTKADALSFAVSFRESRKVSSAPLHDAIYVERFSRLLPTWSVSEGSTDEEILGQWLTGGVSIPVTSFRRLSSLLGWLGKKDVAELVLAAGFSVPQGAAGAPTPTTTAGAKPSTRSRQPFCLPGRPVLEAFFKDHVIHVVEHAERYRRFGIAFPAAIVLHGPPGCGKTFAVERLGEHLGWPVFPIDSNSIASRYIHDTSKKIGEVFDRAMDAAPSLIVIDEMEAYLSDRQIHHSTGLHHVEEVGEFLRRIPEAGQGQVLVIGMTNRLEMIDAAILR